MRTADIVNHLQVCLPRLVDDFTDSIDLVSITSDGTDATVTTVAAHGLTVGRQVNIVGAQTPIDVSIARVGIIATLTTATDHDYTEYQGATVVIDGTAEYDGEFDILSVPNRRTVTIQVSDTLAVSDSGQVLNGSNVFASYNGLHTVTAVDTATTFKYSLAKTLPDAVGGAIKGNPRISGATNFERLLQSYTAQPQDDAYLFVVMGDAIAHKDRNTDTDSTANIQRGANFNQRLSQAINLYVFLPTAANLTGRAARDRCVELLQPICQCLLRARFPSLVSSNNNPIAITSHGFEAYNGAFYVHQYGFEATVTLTDEDTFSPDDDVAFRDIELTIGVDLGTGEMVSDIDLDEQPL